MIIFMFACTGCLSEILRVSSGQHLAYCTGLTVFNVLIKGTTNNISCYVTVNVIITLHSIVGFDLPHKCSPIGLGP